MKNIVDFIQKFGTRPKDELTYLVRLSSVDRWGMIEKRIPETLTTEAILASFGQLAQDLSRGGTPAWDVDNVISRDLVLPQVKLMSLLPQTTKGLFMLYVKLINFFGHETSDCGWRHESSSQVVGMANAVLVRMLLNPDSADEWEINTNEGIKGWINLASPGLFSLDEQGEMISVVEAVLNCKDEASAFNLARLLHRLGILTTEAVESYWAELKHQQGTWVARYTMCRSEHDPHNNGTLQVLCLARLDLIGAVKALECVEVDELKSVHPAHG